MRTELGVIGGFGLGAGLMYLLDPDRGRRRRAMVRDRMTSTLSDSGASLDKAARDLKNRARGVAAEARHALRRGKPEDDVLVARVRSKLGRLVTHPHAIEVHAQDGVVTLGGPVLESEAEALLSGVSSVRGVSRVENRLEKHKRPEEIPLLQGGPARPPRQRFELMQTNWSPATRWAVGAAGGGMTAYAVARRDPLAIAMGVAGGLLLARSISNKEFRRLTGIRAGRRAIDIQKSINIVAPVERVYDFWTHYENFPRFMSHLREVRDLGHGRSHWVADGPAHLRVEWDAELTVREPNRVLGWKSVRGSMVESAGIVHFHSNPDSSTRVDIKLSYNPPAGAIGHALASLFGADPKTAMDDDLIRLKSLIETGKTRAHGTNVYSEK